MRNYFVTIEDVKNAGVAREWAVCRYYGICRTKHDSSAYDVDSDVNFGEKHISVKAEKFTLMSGKLCNGEETFDGIWALYESKVHSNTFAYVTKDGCVYEMNIHEFKEFVYEFCRLERESSKNGGYMKIRCRCESKYMIEWLQEKVA